MMNALKQLHVEPNDDLRELASLYALDALVQEEKAAYEAHLGAGCAVCVAEVASFHKVTGAIGLSVDPVSPQAELRERLMETIARTPQPRAQESPGVLYEKDGVIIARPAEMTWAAGELPGVFLKVLFNDTTRGYTTAMVRMTPGTRYPSHQHAGVEELYLLEGDLCVGDMVMRAGDYCRGEARSIHEEIATENGCLFVVTSSDQDQLLV
jgi:anti-sigma factor ChrR (cupin superfamily)